MKARTKRRIKKTARAGLSGIGFAIGLVLKIIGTVILIGVTTGAIMACIFVIYIKTNLLTEELGVTFEEMSLNQTSVIYYYNKQTENYEELVALQSKEGSRFWVDYEDFPWYLEKALVSVEDRRFYKHDGVDWFRTSGAFVNMFLGMRSTFGGSTITQQLIKNSLKEDDVTVQRKLKEIFRALETEKKYEKWQILTWYLNRVNFGQKNEGIGAAARYYFDKDVKNLTMAECACIVGITNNPSMYNPRFHPEANKERQELILDLMAKEGYITKAQAEEAKAEELKFAFKSAEKTSITRNYTWFEEAVYFDVLDYFMESRNLNEEDAKILLLNGGYKIYCTMDADIQAKVDSIYKDLSQLPETKGSKQQLQSSMVISDPYTGDIVAIAGKAGEKTEVLGWNYATMMRRAPGSSIKPVSAYAPAMNMGLITPDTLIEDEPDIVLNGTADWFPHNDVKGDYEGIIDIRYALRRSKNTVAAQLVDMVTTPVSYDFLTQKLKMKLNPADMAYAPLALGQMTDGVTVREMAQGYGMFLNEGKFVELRTFSKIFDANGRLVCDNVPDAYAVISPATAYWMTDILHTGATIGTGSGANLKFMPTAGKTGTSGSAVDRWFVGFTPYYVAACWCGYEMPEQIKLKNSANPASTMWKKVMSLVHEDLPEKKFPVYDDIRLRPVPGVTPVTYAIRGIAVDELGGVEIIYEDVVGRRAVGRTVTVKAKEVEGYTFSGMTSATIVLAEFDEYNIVEFRYDKIPEPEPEPDPFDPNTPEDPNTPTDPDVPPDPNTPEPPPPTETPEPPPETPDTPA